MILPSRRRARIEAAIEAATAEHVAAFRRISRPPIRDEVDRMAAAGHRQWEAWLTYAPNVARTGSLR